MKLLIKISEILLALLFLFSGFAKAINPFGLSIQLGDYLVAMHLDFLLPLTTLLAILLPVAEMTIGAMLILGQYKRLAVWAVTLFMSFFTLLTLWIAVYNPVKDCGCFGDLLKISNWDTFIKNIIFMIPTVVLFLNRRNYTNRGGYLKLGSVIALFLILPIYTSYSLPIIDATPYKLGTNLWEALNDGVPDKTTTTLIYKNRETGKTKEFEIEDTQWQDSIKWEFQDTKTKVVEQGKPSTIKELPMIDNDGVDKSSEVLQTPDDLLLIVVQEPLEQKEKIKKLIEKHHDKKAILLHCSITKELENEFQIECLVSDQSIIRAVIQNNSGGYLVLRNSNVIIKSVI